MMDRATPRELGSWQDGSDYPASSSDTQVTAIVVTHNSARHLAALGHALASSSFAPERKLVIDNASVDDTVARARLAGFEVRETESNDGFGSACNAGLRVTSTEFVLLCNPDVLPSPGALEMLVTALTTNPMAAIAGAGEARRFSRISRELTGFLPRSVQHRTERFGGSAPVARGDGQIVVDYTVGAFILCRAAALNAVGGFDECFFLYGEEEDLSRRLGRRGWQTVLVPSALIAHEVGASSDGVDNTDTAPFRLHSLYWYYRKYHSRLYAELARYTLAICVVIDCLYRALLRREQVYGLKTAAAPFRSIDSIRSEFERRTKPPTVAWR
jgi:GT2 family glycosyltransferase